MIKIKFDDTFINDEAIMSLSQQYKMFENSFYLGATPCRSITLEIYKDYFTTIPEIVRLYDNDELYCTLHVDSCEQVDKTKYKFELTDAMTLMNESYDASSIVSENTTLLDVANNICNKYNVTLVNQDFYGKDKIITWYDNTISARDYIGFIAELNGGYAIINNEGNIELKQFTNETTHEINVNECEDLTLGERHYITRVVYDTGVLKWEQGEETGNTVYINTSNTFITEESDIENIYNNINEFEFYALNTGNCIDVGGTTGETINFIDGNNIYPTILQIEKKYNGSWIGGYKNEINTETMQETEIIDNEIRIKTINTKLNRDEAQLEIVAQETTNINNNLTNNYYNITQTNELILNSKEGLTNTFSEAGGNNIFRNTGLWFIAESGDNLVYPSEEIYPGNDLYPTAYDNYEYWVGDADKGRNDNSSSGNSILLKNNIFSQEQDVPNGNYSISFYYRKTNPLANASVKINDKEYALDSEEWKQFYTGEQDSDGNYIVQPIEVSSGHLKIDFVCNIDGAVEVYDLMANKGSVKLAWSQNQNETTTDTVNISKGITITSSDTESVFKANADGIRVLDRSGNKTTWFTDKGTSTKELIVEKQAQISGILINEVDDQTWITRM